MAGKKQHFIPQFIQRGFLSKKKPDKSYQYHKERGIVERTIVEIGSENYFYSKTIDTEITLDKKITDEEILYTNILNKIKINNIDRFDIARIISHFEMRTRNFRQSFGDMAQYALENIFSASNEEKFKEIRKNEMLNNHTIKNLVNQINKIIPNSSIQALEKSLLEVNGVLEELINNNFIKKQISDAHNNVLDKNLESENKIDIYSKLKYQLVNSENLIPLGDSIVIFHVEGKRKFKPSFDLSDKLKAIIFPITSHSILIGSNENYLPNFIEIIENICSCSIEFFIADEKKEFLKNMVKYIGTNSYILQNNEMDNILNDILK